MGIGNKAEDESRSLSHLTRGMFAEYSGLAVPSRVGGINGSASGAE